MIGLATTFQSSPDPPSLVRPYAKCRLVKRRTITKDHRQWNNRGRAYTATNQKCIRRLFRFPFSVFPLSLTSYSSLAPQIGQHD